MPGAGGGGLYPHCTLYGQSQICWATLKCRPVGQGRMTCWPLSHWMKVEQLAGLGDNLVVSHPKRSNNLLPQPSNKSLPKSIYIIYFFLTLSPHRGAHYQNYERCTVPAPHIAKRLNIYVWILAKICKINKAASHRKVYAIN